MVEGTWDSSKASRGHDAQGLSHTSIEVTSVEQIENSHLYQVYEHKKKEFCMRAAKGSFEKVTSNPGETDVLTSTLGISKLDDQLIPEINEYFLFHGVQQEFIDAIQGQGIDFRLNSRAMFGKGAYFAESSTKADQYADHRDNRTQGPHSMFLCKVILGHSHIVKAPNKLLTRPPCLHQCTGTCSHGTSEFFDSVMGTHRDNGQRLLFREFVIFGQNQIYPAFLISYKRK
ncbi:hypothetical protein NP493_1161g00004 [Ridgeia piscesae]|uniref:Poly [ADP-ribose] polymerase n=1 Tax=Ridgeia piscesae TaxID=27915 RepID=A0AAD9NIW4_RIDPI|nr:hypothetical protein NP493_1161g00004 [Ridgeia piscesae]